MPTRAPAREGSLPIHSRGRYHGRAGEGPRAPDRFGGPCFVCGQPSHRMKHCPYLEDLKQRLRTGPEVQSRGEGCGPQGSSCVVTPPHCTCGQNGPRPAPGQPTRHSPHVRVAASRGRNRHKGNMSGRRGGTMPHRRQARPDTARPTQDPGQTAPRQTDHEQSDLASPRVQNSGNDARQAKTAACQTTPSRVSLQ